MMTRFAAIQSPILLALVGLTSGCTNLQLPQAPIQSPAEEREECSDEAIRKFDQTRNSAQFQAAVNRLTMGDTTGAEQMAQNILARTPSHRAAGLLLADIYLAQEKPKAARTLLEGMLDEHPDDARIHYTLGLVLETSGASDSAAAHFKRALVLEPAHEEYRYASSSAESAGSDVASGTPASRAASVVPRLEVVLTAAQTAQARQLLRSSLEGSDTLDTEEAAALLTAACEVEPRNSQLPIRAATYLLQSGQPDRAVAFLQPATQRDPHNHALLQVLGAAHLQLGQHHESQFALRQALSLDNANPLSYFIMGCSLRESGLTEEAERSFATAARLDARYQVPR